MDPRSNHNSAAFAPAPQHPPQQPPPPPPPPPPQPIPQIVGLPPQPAPAFARPALGLTPSPYGQNRLLPRSRLQKSPYRLLVASAPRPQPPQQQPPPPPPPPPPAPPAPGPVVRPVVAGSAYAIQGNGMPQYMQPAPFYLPAHARHHHHASIRGELAARVAFRRSMDAADAVFGQTTREAYEAMDRALGRQ